VGLLPGGGGTQRLPRLIGIEAALPVLLDGARIGGAAAIAADSRTNWWQRVKSGSRGALVAVAPTCHAVVGPARLAREGC